MVDGYSRLYFWIQGDDDERFVNRILFPKFARNYHFISPIKYSAKKPEYVNNYIVSMLSMSADYIFLEDINSCNCCTEKKMKIRDKYEKVENGRIIIASAEIESWYYAGLNETICNSWNIPVLDNTDTLTKEKFNQIFNSMREPRVIILNRILDNFSFQTAKQKNSSFNYFCNKYNI